jgi:hypothetical protein
VRPSVLKNSWSPGYPVVSWNNRRHLFGGRGTAGFEMGDCLGAKLLGLLHARFGHQTAPRIEHRRSSSAAARRQVRSLAHDDDWHG